MTEAHLPSHTGPFETHMHLRDRLTEAVLAQTAFNHPGLVAFLRQRFSGSRVSDGALLAEPIIEAANGFVTAKETLAELSGGLLQPKLVAALTGGVVSDYRLPLEFLPYAHQLESWRQLTAQDPRSVLVTSGTGSGKTECFLIPLLNDLVLETQDNGGNPLSGVRAIMLYPLNALIASQEERLKQWTAPFRGLIRFGLYNGMMPQDDRASEIAARRASNPEQVFERKTLRRDPPPILVTNVTMLEYLTIRKDDRPLVERSTGKLRWIIIDEAHSYVGSAAAEIALLLRRVLQTFKVRAQDVRFVATSATIGGKGEQARRELRQFLAGLSGVDEEQICVVEGTRAPTNLPPADGVAQLSSDVSQDVGRLVRHPKVQALIRAAEENPLGLHDAEAILSGSGLEAVPVIEALAGKETGKPVLPFRVHQFARGISGLWSCLNPDCKGNKPDGWPFGAIHFESTHHCITCKAPVFEIIGCRECGEPYLNAFERDGVLTPAADFSEVDDFVSASDYEPSVVGEDDESDTAPTEPGEQRLIVSRSLSTLAIASVDLATGCILERKGAGTPLSITRLNWDGSCPHCSASAGKNKPSPLRPVYFGAPFLLGNATPVLLEGVPPVTNVERFLPAEGRRLLSFTDSRQGTARFAANIETNSERSFVRSFLYHLVQKTSSRQDDADQKAEDLRAQIATLLPIVGSDANSPLRGTLDFLRTELTKAEAPPLRGVSWNDARLALAQERTVALSIANIWKDRDRRFENPEVLANFLLLRELDRRPRRANSVETMGLVRLQFQGIEKIGDRDVPLSLRTHGKTLRDWQDFLYLMIDTPVRSDYALRVEWDDVRWLLPRQGTRRVLISPGGEKRGKSDRTWPRARVGAKANPVRILERALQLDSSSAEDRAQVNEILEAAWRALEPLFNTGSEYSLDLGAATLMPVERGWLCPVSRRVLSHLAFGKTSYGLRNHSPLADQLPMIVDFPNLPAQFPRQAADRRRLRDWLQGDPGVANLRALGLWGNLHDRLALYSAYIRTEEHSAQQPPQRLRGFEREFRDGEINLLACSTTMEMGVDIGSVSAVMMTNVPPSIANYRQRVGRAGRRGQGFSMAMTLAKDTPLERETFRQPIHYLRRELRAPQVKLDSEPIVQRHVNALLLARWFAGASGEFLKVNTGSFFGCPENVKSPGEPHPLSKVFCDWLDRSETRMALNGAIAALTRGTVLDGAYPGVFESTKVAFEAGQQAFRGEWSALREEAQVLEQAARKGVELQLKRLCREHLLKELANRSILPGHGFPLSVVTFVNDCKESRLFAVPEQEATTTRRYNFPSRDSSVAIREYAPGADVVVDGLVWRSAGVTLNWKRPADQEDVREIQSLKYFWECTACGAADCSHIRPDYCPLCGNAFTKAPRQFLEPAGFCVDWFERPHADTDNVDVVPPENPRVSIRSANWQPLLNPALGRIRSSHDGIVFYASSGRSHRGYRVCLLCGRAAEESEDGANPLADHIPLRGGTKGGDTCRGAANPFGVTTALALGHHMQTDVVEIQPADLQDPGAAWAIASALREALSRRLGIEAGELGLTVERRRGLMGQNTHSVYLYDSAEGGAGFAASLLDDLVRVLEDARSILDCTVPGCERGCGTCVLTRDLYESQSIIDRVAGLAAMERLLAGMHAPDSIDMSMPGAIFSVPVADALGRAIRPRDTVTVFTATDFDLVAFNDEPLTTLFSHVKHRRARLQVVLPVVVIDSLSAAERLGLRDAAIRHGFDLYRWQPQTAANGALLLATLQSTASVTAWMSRDHNAAVFGVGWGQGTGSPIVSGTPLVLPSLELVGLDVLLPKADAAVLVLQQDKRHMLKRFGVWIVQELRIELEKLGLWLPGELLRLSYSDRYLRSPLTGMLALRTFAALRDQLGADRAILPVAIQCPNFAVTQDRSPYQLHHDWVRNEDRKAVAVAVAKNLSLALEWTEDDVPHARVLHIHYRSGVKAQLFWDQGFGHWRTLRNERFEFVQPVAAQACRLLSIDPVVCAEGSTHISIKAG